MALKMLMVWLVLAVAAVRGTDDTSSDAVVVAAPVGRVRGRRHVVDRHFSYVAFKGVPYAKAPVQQRRFQAPEAIDAWKDILDASSDGPLCPQFDIATGKAIGDEDCLTLNIYTPSSNGSRAVMVYLHGGGYVLGGGVSYFFGPQLLVEKDVVLVTVQYRLGALGFLSTGDGRAAGNWALHDQLTALRWVQANIDAFGGDAASVTLFGEDTGAAAATLLALSPLADGLFHRVIAMSGNALCAQYLQPKPRDAAVELGRRLQCLEHELVDCLRRVPVQDLVVKSNDMYILFSFPRWFAPVVDGLVLTATPEALLVKGAFHRLPTVVGMTKEEGAFFYRLTLNTMNSGRYDDSFLDNLPRLLPLMSEMDRRLLPLSKAIRKKYFRNVDLDQEDQFRPKYVEFLTDLLYTRCTDRYARLLANHSVPTYRYLFEYRGQYSIVNLQGENADLGVAHGDDLQYVFSDLWGQDVPMSAADLKFSRNVFVPLLANFAKTSVPTPRITDSITTAWPPLSAGKQRLYRIGTRLALDAEYRADASRFWNEEVPALLAAGKKKTTAADAAAAAAAAMPRSLKDEL